MSMPTVSTELLFSSVDSVVHTGFLSGNLSIPVAFNNRDTMSPSFCQWFGRQGPPRMTKASARAVVQLMKYWKEFSDQASDQWQLHFKNIVNFLCQASDKQVHVLSNDEWSELWKIMCACKPDNAETSAIIRIIVLGSPRKQRNDIYKNFLSTLMANPQGTLSLCVPRFHGRQSVVYDCVDPSKPCAVKNTCWLPGTMSLEARTLGEARKAAMRYHVATTLLPPEDMPTDEFVDMILRVEDPVLLRTEMHKVCDVYEIPYMEDPLQMTWNDVQATAVHRQHLLSTRK